jgi:Zn-finger nucleic acid-binding protein
MDCPRCQTTALLMTARNDVEIDYCPTCRGVWLDRGELDKIIERADNQIPRYGDHRSHRDDDFDDFDDRREGRFGQKRKRKRSLAELFDF